MNQDLQALRDAVESDEFRSGSIEHAQNLATEYVQNHPDEFIGHREVLENADHEAHAREQCVADVDYYRSQGRDTDWWRCEAWHLHRWHPMHIGGDIFKPNVRNNDGILQPQVRNHV
jgi:hypothetical protein